MDTRETSRNEITIGEFARDIFLPRESEYSDSGIYKEHRLSDKTKYHSLGFWRFFWDFLRFFEIF